MPFDPSGTFSTASLGGIHEDASSAMVRSRTVALSIAPRNTHGILEHWVTLFQHPPMEDDELEHEGQVVLSDLEKLKDIVEKP
jgi:hypothetical protein